jgi:spermidine/putrescine-binding protein
MSVKLNKKESYKFLNDMTEKYVDLVWYARCNNPSDELEKIEKLYPEEINNLKNCNDNWYHGYHSGILAALRLIENGNGVTDVSISEFPNLDS